MIPVTQTTNKHLLLLKTIQLDTSNDTARQQQHLHRMHTQRDSNTSCTECRGTFAPVVQNAEGHLHQVYRMQQDICTRCTECRRTFAPGVQNAAGHLHQVYRMQKNICTGCTECSRTFASVVNKSVGPWHLLLGCFLFGAGRAGIGRALLYSELG